MHILVYGTGLVLGVMLAGGEHAEMTTQFLVSTGGLLLAGISAWALFRS